MTKEQARTAYLAGFQFGAQDAREHPEASNDPWEGTNGARRDLSFERWYAGQHPVVEEKRL